MVSITLRSIVRTQHAKLPARDSTAALSRIEENKEMTETAARRTTASKSVTSSNAMAHSANWQPVGVGQDSRAAEETQGSAVRIDNMGKSERWVVKQPLGRRSCSTTSS